MISRISAALLAVSLCAGTAMAETAAPAHDHNHDHGHDHAAAPAAGEKTVAKGYFENAQVQDRPLSDWEGKWQSVYPLLTDGTLDPVMAHKAEHGDKTAAEYRSYYDTGYKTDVDAIEIIGDEVRFASKDKTLVGHYAYDGHEILTYEKGNRGVRFIFAKKSGDEAAPKFIQFSDHIIAPQKSGHFHLYWGDDRAAVLKELTNWPTYYPADMTPAQVVDEMNAH